MSSLEQVLKAYEGPDQFFLHNINATDGQSRQRNFCTIIRVPGGAGRSRTDDILLAKQALYQLSYGPIPTGIVASSGELSVRVMLARSKPEGLALKQRTSARFALAPPAKMLVGPGRLELPTSRLSGVRSNQAELRAYGRTTAGSEIQARDRTLHSATSK